MMKLPIADCRLPINGLFAGRGFARGGHDGGQFVGFVEQVGQLACGHDAGFNQQFEPKCGLVGFFFDDSDLGDEFRRTTRTATGAVVGGNGSSAADNLLGDGAGGVIILWNCLGQLDDSQSKSFCPGLEFNRSHGVKLQTQSAIGNRQSSIQK